LSGWLGAMELRVSVPGARTRKDWRQGLRSVRDGLRTRHSVSVSLLEPEGGDKLRSVLISHCAPTKADVERLFDRIRAEVGSHPIVELVEVHRDVHPWERPAFGSFYG